LRRTIPLLLGLALLGGAQAQDKKETAARREAGAIFFVSGEARHFSGVEQDSLNEDAPLSVDAVFTFSHDRFRLFGEYLLTTREHDLERFQVGYEPVADTQVWLGRYHQPASAWNNENHHGRYLQTAITRPSVELWEDEGGILPQHLTGVLLESRLAAGESAGVQAHLGIGLAPTVEDGELVPFDLLSPSRDGRHWSWSARLAYQPQLLSPTQFGVLAAQYRMPVVDPMGVAGSTDPIEQDVYGGYANVQEDPWRVSLAIYDVWMKQNGSKEDFWAGYVQVERQFRHALTLYGRVEDSWGAEDSRYIQTAHRGFELRAAVAGLRWDFRSRQALTVEAARSTTLDGNRSEYRLQWSAALQ